MLIVLFVHFINAEEEMIKSIVSMAFMYLALVFLDDIISWIYGFDPSEYSSLSMTMSYIHSHALELLIVFVSILTAFGIFLVLYNHIHKKHAKNM